jgi:hypothetical protein
MAVAIALLSVATFASGCGGGVTAWLMALPGAFIALQVLGFVVVMLCGILEKVGLVRSSSRPVLHDFLIHGALLGSGFALLGSPLMRWVLAYFVVMYLIRVIFRASWEPGEPLEVGS